MALNGWSEMKSTCIEKLKKAFAGDLGEYRSVPFWSWNNELDETALIEQIDEMKRVGIGGFIMHARTGLTTEYLGEKWFSCIGACLKRAKELNMNAWIYDENGWPSGFVGGKLLETEAYRARFLEYAVCTQYDEQAFCVYKKTENGYVRLDAAEDDVSEYHTIYLRVSPSNTDILNPDVVEAFIQETHEQYYQRFKDSFGKELVGFFTDEPQYYRWGTPYPVKVADEFLKKFNEDVRDGLIYLFMHDETGYAFRTRYFNTLNEMYVHTFYQRLYDWCDEHGCMLTGHSVEEPRLYTQMWGGGGVMPTYEYEHIPGIDSLGFQGEPVLSSRQVGSVAAQLDKKFVLTESFACGGHDVTPVNLRHVGEMQYFNGVNLMCQHLLPFSFSAQGKYDHPPIFYKQNNWWEESKEFNEYFVRLGYIIANTKDVADVLVVHPMRCVYLEYIRSEDLESVRALEEAFNKLLDALNRNGVTYHLADETLLKKYGKAEDGKMVIGCCQYDKVLVPEMPSMADSTLKLLEQYTGKLCMLGKVSYVDGKATEVGLTANCSFEDLVAECSVPFRVVDGMGAITVRGGELGNFAFVKNHSICDSMTVSMPVASQYVVLNLETMEISALPTEFTLEAGKGLVLLRKDDTEKLPSKQAFAKGETEQVASAFRVTGMSENYLVLDRAQLSFDGKNFGEELPLAQIFENLLYKNFRGEIYVKQTFNVDEKLPLTLMVEKNRFLSVTLNGQPLEFHDSDFDIYFAEADISKCVREGENEYVYCVDYFQRDLVRFALFDPLATEAVRNCLYYDTYLENAYVKGRFTVGENRTLYVQKEFPKLSKTWQKEGYPFFYGEVELCGKYAYDGKGSREIALQGNYITANVLSNGKQVNLVFDTEKDITSILKQGENDVRIVLKSSLRNLMGPHHNKFYQEKQSLGPDVFTLYKSFRDGASPAYKEEYALANFGIDGITIVTKN